MEKRKSLRKSRRKQRRTGPLDLKAVPLPLKIFGVMCVVLGAVALPYIILELLASIEQFALGDLSGTTLSSAVIMVVQVALSAIFVVFSVFLGIRLLRNKRRHAALTANTLLVLAISVFLCEIMLRSLNASAIIFIVFVGVLIALSSFLDPSLSDERKLQRKLRKMENQIEAKELATQAGRDISGKGYITLNFFNIFWLFILSSVFGLLIETIYHIVMFGIIEDRAGLLFGPFSPIYGFGGLLMTVALNRFYKKSFVLIFLASAVIGGAFEYLVSWFLQFSFGITAWDYTGTWLSIDGRTNGMYMIFWGILGLAWVKLLLPGMLKLVNRIPWNWRYSVTSVFAVLMIINGAATLMAFDFWYSRSAGNIPERPIEQLFANSFSDDYMENRFQSMTMDPDKATRI